MKSREPRGGIALTASISALQSQTRGPTARKRALKARVAPHHRDVREGQLDEVVHDSAMTLSVLRDQSGLDLAREKPP